MSYKVPIRRYCVVKETKTTWELAAMFNRPQEAIEFIAQQLPALDVKWIAFQQHSVEARRTVK